MIYCDHNFIVTSRQESDSYKDHLRQLVANGAATFVLSPMHWVEAAEDNHAPRGICTADFMDSLGGRWMYYRRTVQRKEVAHAFFRFAGIPTDTPQMIGDVSDIIADLAGQRAFRDSRAFVAHLREIGANHPLERSLNRAFETNQHNIALFRAGRLTSSVTQTVERQYIEPLLPIKTPAGDVIDSDTKSRFVSAFQLTDFPGIALEMRATHDNWQVGRELSRNNFMDQQHLIALPYVDFFITDDGKLRSLIGRISAGLPFPIATLLTKAEFDRRYP